MPYGGGAGCHPITPVEGSPGYLRTMDVVVALHAAAALLLLIAGLAKIARPGPTTELLVSLGVPAREPVARVIGLAEAAVGITTLAVGRSEEHTSELQSH